MEMKLKELCEKAGVSRRAVQGYEKAGLVWAVRKNGYGYLMYDETALERTKRIRLYQNMGFTIRQITEIMDAPNDVLKAALMSQLAVLEHELYAKEQLICQVKMMIEKL